MRDKSIVAMLALAMAITPCFADDTPTFKITPKRSDDRVEVKPEDTKVAFLIYSPFGISSATIERTTEHWPNKVVIELHLKGLESFSVANGDLILEASVSSRNGDARLWMNRKEDSALDAESPYWMQIRMLGRDGKMVKTIPLTDGYFEMQLPKKILEGNPKSITVQWTDFYR